MCSLFDYVTIKILINVLYKQIYKMNILNIYLNKINKNRTYGFYNGRKIYVYIIKKKNHIILRSKFMFLLIKHTPNVGIAHYIYIYVCMYF